MILLTKVLIALIALQHFFFLIIEIFFWDKPFGMKIFKTDEGFANDTAALAANQGLYNGFLGAGLIWSLTTENLEMSYQLQLFFLSCVLAAGIFGWFTVSKTILFVQALPAIFTLMLVLFLF